MSIQTPKGPIVATDTDFVGQVEPWSEFLVERRGKKAIRVRVKLQVTHIFVTDELSQAGEPIVSVNHQVLVKAEELDDNPAQLTR